MRRCPSIFKSSPVIETHFLRLNLSTKLSLEPMIRWTLWLIKDFIDPVSTRAHTRTPSIKQSTNGWLISILFKFVLTIGWSLLPPERGPSLRCLKEQDKHERHVLVLRRRNISVNVPIEVHVLGAGNREKSVQLVSS